MGSRQRPDTLRIDSAIALLSKDHCRSFAHQPYLGVSRLSRTFVRLPALELRANLSRSPSSLISGVEFSILRGAPGALRSVKLRSCLLQYGFLTHVFAASLRRDVLTPSFVALFFSLYFNFNFVVFLACGEFWETWKEMK